MHSLNSQQFNYSTIPSAQTTGIYYTNGKNYFPLTQSTVGLCLRDRLTIELTFHFLSRRICAKIPSYVNLSICFTVLLHERENYIALNYPILYAVVLSFSSSGANCHEIGGDLSRHWGELSGANCMTFV